MEASVVRIQMQILLNSAIQNTNDDLTWLDLTWLDLTWLDLTWLDTHQQQDKYKQYITRNKTTTWLLITNKEGHMTRTYQWETRHVTWTTNQNMTLWTEEPIAKRHESKGIITQKGTITKLQNKKQQNKNIEQNQKQTLH